MMSRSYDISLMAVLLVVASFKLDSSAHAASNCGNLSEILNGARAGFNSLLGAQHQDGKWDSTVQIAGFDHCVVEQDADQNFVVSCLGNVIVDRDTYLSEYKIHRDRIQGCRSDDWLKLSDTKDSVAYTLDGVIVSLNQLRAIDMEGHRAATKKYFAAIKGAIQQGKTFDGSLPDIETYSGWQSNLRIYAAAPPAPIPRKSATTLDAAAMRDGLCDALQQAMRDSPSGFSTLRGEESGEDTWNSKLTLPGTRDCDINGLKDGDGKVEYYLSCLISQYPDREAAMQDANEVAKMTSGCLPDGWRGRVRQRPDGKATITYRRSDEEPTVSIRLTTRRSDWVVRMDVDQPSP